MPAGFLKKTLKWKDVSALTICFMLIFFSKFIKLSEAVAQSCSVNIVLKNVVKFTRKHSQWYPFFYSRNFGNTLCQNSIALNYNIFTDIVNNHNF